MASKISAEYEQVQWHFMYHIYGKTISPATEDIWKSCMNFVRWYIPEPLIDEFMRVHTMEDSDQRVGIDIFLQVLKTYSNISDK